MLLVWLEAYCLFGVFVTWSQSVRDTKQRVFKQTPAAAPASESEHHLNYAYNYSGFMYYTPYTPAVRTFLLPTPIPGFTSTCRRGKSGYRYIQQMSEPHSRVTSPVHLVTHR